MKSLTPLNPLRAISDATIATRISAIVARGCAGE